MPLNNPKKGLHIGNWESFIDFAHILRKINRKTKFHNEKTHVINELTFIFTSSKDISSIPVVTSDSFYQQNTVDNINVQ